MQPGKAGPLLQPAKKEQKNESKEKTDEYE